MLSFEEFSNLTKQHVSQSEYPEDLLILREILMDLKPFILESSRINEVYFLRFIFQEESDAISLIRKCELAILVEDILIDCVYTLVNQEMTHFPLNNFTLHTIEKSYPEITKNTSERLPNKIVIHFSNSSSFRTEITYSVENNKQAIKDVTNFYNICVKTSYKILGDNHENLWS